MTVETTSEIFSRYKLRPARMGWLGEKSVDSSKMLATAKELTEALPYVSSLTALARFGDQTHSFALTRSGEGNDDSMRSFSGITFPGKQSNLLDVVDLALLENTHLKWFRGFFDFIGVPHLGDVVGRDNPPHERPPLKIIKYRVRKQDGSIMAMSVPCADFFNRGVYGVPPFRKNFSGRTARALSIMQFHTPTAREQFERMVHLHPSPVKFLNAFYSILFSPDVVNNLMATDDHKHYEQVVTDGAPNQSHYRTDIDYLTDVAGLGFSVQGSINMGMNNPVL